jgi:hypothetical protein
LGEKPAARTSILLAGRRGQYCYGGPKVLPYLGLKLVVMPSASNRDLSKVVSKLLSEMHEMRLEWNATNGRVSYLERPASEGYQALRENSHNPTAGITRTVERLRDYSD